MELHPHEIRVLKALKHETTPQGLADECGLALDAVLRASSWLKTKGLVEVKESQSEGIELGEEGLLYAKMGLPERQVLAHISRGIKLDELKAKVPPAVFSVGLGWLRKKGHIEIKDGIVSAKDANPTPDEDVFEMLKKGPLNGSDLNKAQKEGLALLKTRKSIVKVKDSKAIMLRPTPQGLHLAQGLKDDDRISQLTPEILVGGSWKGKGFRPYDTGVYVKPQPPVRKHPLRRQINRIRDIFVGMGFEEVRGPLVESAFWNFDALFQPQDHPAREMHDTFYLKSPKTIPIEGFERHGEQIKNAHENGGSTGSSGWGYRWDSDMAKKTLLRTHTTAVTARHLANAKRQDLPIKVFSIGKCFRNEAIDYKHLPEFYQVEGIVADPSVTFPNLLGILRQFYSEMGFSKIRFRPAYFPYTEMSLEPEVWFEERKEWVELGGAGIFRPEVVKPLLGIDVPVLAWGLGLERTINMSLGVSDIRDLYISDVDWLKEN